MTSSVTQNGDNQVLSPSTGSIRNHDIDRKRDSLEAELSDALDAVTPDEYEVEPSDKTKDEARSLFLHLLPFVSPVISCLPEGGICFQWTVRPSSILSISVFGDGSLTYAVTLKNEGERHRGTVRLNKEHLPETVEKILRKHFASEEMKWIQTSPTMSQ